MGWFFCHGSGKTGNNQRWNPRGRALGLEDPRGQLMVSLALALASDAKSLALALASQSNLTVLVFGLESKTLNSRHCFPPMNGVVTLLRVQRLPAKCLCQ